VSGSFDPAISEKSTITGPARRVLFSPLSVSPSPMRRDRVWDSPRPALWEKPLSATVSGAGCEKRRVWNWPS
jgi:hypothetical protein